MTNQNVNMDLNLNLLDNGIDFLLKGIDELFDEDDVLWGYSDPVDIDLKRYKYGTLHLFSGFLLLLKERLLRHLPELIFKGKIEEVKKKLSSSKSPNTVDLDEALERLEIGPRFVFSKNELQVIRDMQDFRNQFEHYKVSANKYKLWKIISDFLALIDNFLVKELQINLESSTDSQQLRSKIESIESVWKRIEQQRKKKWQSEIEAKFIEFEQTKDDVIAYLESENRINKGAINIYIECPECGEETLIANGDFKGICSNEECLNVFPLTYCDRCGEIAAGFYWELNICSLCEAFIEEE